MGRVGEISAKKVGDHAERDEDDHAHDHEGDEAENELIGALGAQEQVHVELGKELLQIFEHCRSTAYQMGRR